MQETIWQNEAHARRTIAELDSWYLVRVPNGTSRFEEWRIITPDEFPDGMYTPYSDSGYPSRDEATLFASEFTVRNPTVPVRVERVSLLPAPVEFLGTYDLDMCKTRALMAAKKRANDEYARMEEIYGGAKEALKEEQES